jgi:hypothetical protein
MFEMETANSFSMEIEFAVSIGVVAGMDNIKSPDSKSYKEIIESGSYWT